MRNTQVVAVVAVVVAVRVAKAGCTSLAVVVNSH